MSQLFGVPRHGLRSPMVSRSPPMPGWSSRASGSRVLASSASRRARPVSARDAGVSRRAAASRTTLDGSPRDHISTATSSTASQDSETEPSALRIGLSRRRFSVALEPTRNSTACRRNSCGVGVTMTSCLSSRSSRQSARRSTSSVSP